MNGGERGPRKKTERFASLRNPNHLRPESVDATLL
jgi:hypothetical protein